MGSCGSTASDSEGTADDGAVSCRSAVASPSVPSPLTRLPSDLVHLVMQQLSIDSLARLSCTCRLLRADAMDPAAGRYLLDCPQNVVTLRDSLSPSEYAAAARWKRQEHRFQQQTHSPLGRAHLRVTLCADLSLVGLAPQLAAMSLSQRVVALAQKAAGWAHLSTLDLAGAKHWPVADALVFLHSPGLTRVPSATNVAGVWMTESVQTALCRLPALCTLSVGPTLEYHPSLRLHPSAFASALALRSMVVHSLLVSQLAGLVCAPSVECLNLSVTRHANSASSTNECLRWLRTYALSALSRLRVLHLRSFHFRRLSRKYLGDALRAMTQLRYLYIINFDLNDALRGLIDAGPESMPELRVVQLWSPETSRALPLSLLAPMLLRFLHRFTQVRCCLITHD